VARPSRGYAVGVDIGGTKLAAGLVAADGTVVSRTRRETPAHDGVAVMELVVEVARELAGEAGPCAVGVGAAGMIDLDGVVRYAPNVRWADYPLRAELAERLDGPVTVDNDANVAAWGEFRLGAAVDAPESMVMLTVGTGVGGGLVIDGSLVRGASGLAAEFGHMIVQEGGPLCPCGNRGCLEAMASGNAIGRAATAAVQAGRIPDGSPLSGLPEVSGKDVSRAALAGDPAAIRLLAEAGFWLGVGMASLVNALDPQIVVVGGGAMESGDLLLEPARQSLEDRVLGRRYRGLPPVVPARLSDDAGVVGAALLALQQARAP
jgi:glucokinase